MRLNYFKRDHSSCLSTNGRLKNVMAWPPFRGEQQIIYLVLMLCFLIGCEPATQHLPAAGVPNSLQAAFEEDFRIGVALGRQQIEGDLPKETRLIATQFGSVTPENSMKWEKIHPEPYVFDFELPDKLVADAQANGQQVIGHTLTWHSQIPDWVFEDREGSLIDSTTLYARMQHHISQVVGRYKGKIAGWDVVNEAFNDDGTYRNSKFYQIAGEEYLFKAFEYAQEADAGMELYYNDYSLFRPEKVDAAIRLAMEIRARGLRIDGIGMQGHWGLERPTIGEIEQSVLKIHQAGLKVMITELDIDVLPFKQPVEGADIDINMSPDPAINPYVDGLPAEVDVLQAQRYEQIFGLFLKHSDKITRVTFWGLHDGDSWKNNWPVRGRTNYCLVFDRQQEPKLAYHRIVALKSNKQSQ